MGGVPHWHLSYTSEIGDTIHFGLVSADWSADFAQRHCKGGAKFETGIGEHHLVLPDGRAFHFSTTPKE